MHYCFSIGLAPRESTSSALGSCQYLKNFFYLGIAFYSKFVCSHSESYTEEKADASKNRKPTQSQFQ